MLADKFFNNTFNLDSEKQKIIDFINKITQSKKSLDNKKYLKNQIIC